MHYLYFFYIRYKIGGKEYHTGTWLGDTVPSTILTILHQQIITSSVPLTTTFVGNLRDDVGLY